MCEGEEEEATEIFSLLTPHLAARLPVLFSPLFAACRGRRMVKLRTGRQMFCGLN